jgi:hypothetical protein
VSDGKLGAAPGTGILEMSFTHHGVALGQILIPAKAGIHTAFVFATALWIPAFAGMTRIKRAGEKSNLGRGFLYINQQLLYLFESQHPQRRNIFLVNAIDIWERLDGARDAFFPQQM